MVEIGQILDEDGLARTLRRLAHEIAEQNDDPGTLLVLGIAKGGVPLAKALARHLSSLLAREVPSGVLDVGGHRDDQAARRHIADTTHIPVPVHDRTVVIVDDVLSTGRTIRAALDAVVEHGRPARVRVAVLVDRGHRELPIRPDHVGKNVPTAPGDWVTVRLDAPGPAGVWLESLVREDV